MEISKIYRFKHNGYTIEFEQTNNKVWRWFAKVTNSTYPGDTGFVMSRGGNHFRRGKFIKYVINEIDEFESNLRELNERAALLKDKKDLHERVRTIESTITQSWNIPTKPGTVEPAQTKGVCPLDIPRCHCGSRSVNDLGPGGLY